MIPTLAERRTRRYSLLARYVNLTKDMSALLVASRSMLDNDPADDLTNFLAGDNFTEAAIASWATDAQHMSAVLEERVNSLLGDSYAFLNEAAQMNVAQLRATEGSPPPSISDPPPL